MPVAASQAFHVGVEVDHITCDTRQDLKVRVKVTGSPGSSEARVMSW